MKMFAAIKNAGIYYYYFYAIGNGCLCCASKANR